MFAITVVVRTIPFRFLYTDEVNAAQASMMLANVASDFVTLTDDFGQTLNCKRENISGYISEDLEKSKLAAVELTLHQQRTQNLARKRVQADPSLRHISTMGNSPGVI